MFKSQSKNRSKITVPNASLLDYRSASVTMRLGKIADDYRQLEVLLAQMESKMPPDPATTLDQHATCGPSVRKPR